MIDNISKFINEQLPDAKIYSYNNGESLLADILKRELDVILLDIDMRGMRGMDVAEVFMYITPIIGIVMYLLAYLFWRVSIKHYKSSGN